MTRYFVLISVIVICLVTQGEGRVNNATKRRVFSDKDLPESELVILDRVILRRIQRKQKEQFESFENYGRRNRNATQNVTSSSTTSSNGPCTCAEGICKCCTGPILDLFNQKACMKVTYHPGDFAFDVAMSMNNRILYENSMSGKNPKPICISPPRLSNLKVCAKFFNVFFPGRNFHFCLAMNGQWRSIQLFDMTFDCLRMGANGIVRVRPEDDGGIAIPNPHGGVDAVIDAGDDDIEEYDENVVRSLLGIFDDDDDDDDDEDDD